VCIHLDGSVSNLSKHCNASACFVPFGFIRMVPVLSLPASAREPACTFTALPSKKGEMNDRLEPSAADNTNYLSLHGDEHCAFLPWISRSGKSTADSPSGLLAFVPCRLFGFCTEEDSIMSERCSVTLLHTRHGDRTRGMGSTGQSPAFHP